jgi:hypothetical protein
MIRCDAKIVIAGTVDHNAGGKNGEQHNRRKPHSACIHPKVELSWQLRFGALFPLIFVHWALHFREAPRIYVSESPAATPAKGRPRCASQQIRPLDFRSGSLADIGIRPSDVCFTSGIGHQPTTMRRLTHIEQLHQGDQVLWCERLFIGRPRTRTASVPSRSAS